MKCLHFLFAGLILFILGSCQADVDDILPQPEPPEHTEKKLLEYRWDYDGGTTLDSAKALITEDTVNHIITLWADTLKDSYQRRYYDNEGKLQKILNHKLDTGYKEIDSIMISRPGNGVFKIDFSYSEGEGIQYTISPLADGGKQIEVLSPTGNPDGYHHMIIDKDGLLTYTEYKEKRHKDLPDDPLVDRGRAYYFYDGAKKLIMLKDTSFNAMGDIFTRKYMVTKDNSSNNYLIALFKKMAGPDLEWLMYDRNMGIVPFSFGYEFTPFVHLQNGTILRYVYTSTFASDGQNFVPQGESSFDFTVNYDAKGRIVLYQFNYASVVSERSTFKFFD
jgi:hypothetical protein